MFQFASFDLGCNYNPPHICMKLLPYYDMPSSTHYFYNLFFGFLHIAQTTTLFMLTWMLVPIWYFCVLSVMLPPIYQKFFSVCIFLFHIHLSFQKLIFLECHMFLFSNSSWYFLSIFRLFLSLHHIYVIHIMHQRL